MNTTDNKPIIIGIGGLARSGKDIFVKIAKKILKENGYSCIKLAFADALKEEIDPFLREQYNISAWTDDNQEKQLIRPYLVAHGCGKRIISNGRYWVDKIDQAIESIHFNEDVIFISDCRFPNEADWLHEKWGGWLVHLKKYSVRMDVDHGKLSPNESQFYSDYPNLATNNIPKKEIKIYDQAPNAEEASNDPLCEQKSDYRLELENCIERERRLTGNKISTESLMDYSYLVNEIIACLTKCPFLTIQNPSKPKSIWSSVVNQTKIVSLETQ